MNRETESSQDSKNFVMYCSEPCATFSAYIFTTKLTFRDAGRRGFPRPFSRKSSPGGMSAQRLLPCDGKCFFWKRTLARFLLAGTLIIRVRRERNVTEQTW